MRQIGLLKKFFKSKSYFFLACFTGAVCFAILFLAASIFLVSSIEIYGADPAMSFVGLETLKNRNIFLISSDTIKKNIVETNPFVKKAELVKKYPNTLQIYVDAEKPLAALQSSNKGYFILSETGRILQKKRDKPAFLPIIRYYQTVDYDLLQAGDTVSYTDMLAALRFAKQAADFDFSVDSIDIAGFSMIALNIGEKKILFTTEKDEESQLHQFRTIVRQFKIEGKQFTSLDVRFDKPIAVLKD